MLQTVRLFSLTDHITTYFYSRKDTLAVSTPIHCPKRQEYLLGTSWRTQKGAER